MRLSLLRFYWLKLIGAAIALLLAIVYLAGYEPYSLMGFGVMAFIVTILAIRIRKGTMPATCDLCGAASTMKAEYGAGFSNAKLVITCPRCGRVINGKKGSVHPVQE